MQHLSFNLYESLDFVHHSIIMSILSGIGMEASTSIGRYFRLSARVFSTTSAGIDGQLSRMQKLETILVPSPKWFLVRVKSKSDTT